MKSLSFLSMGILFGIIMTKSEAISWFRIHEMFRFESFHMYGIIGTAVALGALSIWLMKRWGVRTASGEGIQYTAMNLSVKRHLIAGSIFGLGWGLVGCCPGPMYVLIGQGYWIIGVVFLSAVFGTFVYGVVKDYLRH